MLDRNKRIKEKPEKFQLALKERFHVIITCESRIFDEVVRGASGTALPAEGGARENGCRR